MKVSVWDTHVKRENGSTMHFDILVPSTFSDKEKIYEFGRTYLKSKPFKNAELRSKECVLCHIENASAPIIKEIELEGYFIIEIENCN